MRGRDDATPAAADLPVCASDGCLTWMEGEGRGHFASFIVIEDGRLNRRMLDQPYNPAMLTLDADKRLNFYSKLRARRPTRWQRAPPSR